jgi:mono/diheme cytochrome c family protein
MKRVKHAVILGMALTLAAGAAFANKGTTFKEGVHLPEADGAAIYRATCQACHMTNAKGATGAATIPALAGDPKLATAGYPIYVVVNGLGGMPALGADLDDTQVAAVVAYVRTHFGNSDTDPVAPADVAPVRPAGGYPSSD